MDLRRKRGIGAPDLARAQAGGNFRGRPRLPILQEQQIGHGRLVLHLAQRSSQRLGARAVLLGTIVSHQHSPTRSWRGFELRAADRIRQPTMMTIRLIKRVMITACSANSYYPRRWHATW